MDAAKTRRRTFLLTAGFPRLSYIDSPETLNVPFFSARDFMM